jgi:hypothetical protein
MGNLTKDQAVAWLEAKDGRAYNVVLRNKLKSSVENVLADPGTAPGGGNTRYTFQGETMYHTSNGVGAGGGVSLFYIRRPGGIAKIVGIGYHVGAQTYDLTWTHHDWSALRNVNRITLD